MKTPIRRVHVFEITIQMELYMGHTYLEKSALAGSFKHV